MVTVDVKQSLLIEFNRLNKVKPVVAVADINFGTPEVFLQGQCNSRIKLVAKTDAENFGGSQTVYYIRRRMSDDLRLIKIPGKSTDYTRLYEVLKVLREKLGVPLYDNEFLDRAITGSTLNIATTPSCIAYLPADQITLEYAE